MARLLGAQIKLKEDVKAGGKMYRKGTIGRIAGMAFEPSGGPTPKTRYKVEVAVGKFFWADSSAIKAG